MNAPINFFFATLVLLVCTRAIYLIIASATRPTWVAVVRTPPPTDGTEVLLRTKWGIVSGWYAARSAPAGGGRAGRSWGGSETSELGPDPPFRAPPVWGCARSGPPINPRRRIKTPSREHHMGD